MAKDSEASRDANLLAGTCKMACSVLRHGLVRPLTFPRRSSGTSICLVYWGAEPAAMEGTVRDIVYPRRHTALGWMCRKYGGDAAGWRFARYFTSASTHCNQP
jgi:hypothetical protein